MRATGLEFEFARAVDAAVAQVLPLPSAHPAVDQEFRHVFLRRFPYSLIHRVRE